MPFKGHTSLAAWAPLSRGPFHALAEFLDPSEDDACRPHGITGKERRKPLDFQGDIIFGHVVVEDAAKIEQLIGLEWKIGLMAATMAMVGDLFSSFLKRRLKIPPSNRATGLDQIPESLFPALACRSILGLTVLDITSVVVIFSLFLFKWHVRDRPF
jgi:hypothetical protein